MVDAGASPLQLQRVVGFSGDVPSSLLAHPNGEAVVYGVGSVIVVERINGKRQQRLLQGHTAKVQIATAWMPPVANLIMPEWLALWGALMAWVWLRVVDNNEEAAVRYDKTLYGDPVQPFSLHPGHFLPNPVPVCLGLISTSVSIHTAMLGLRHCHLARRRDGGDGTSLALGQGGVDYSVGLPHWRYAQLLFHEAGGYSVSLCFLCFATSVCGPACA